MECGPLGERINPTEYTAVHILTFGDSFTNCNEVSANETWQAYLSELTESNVLIYPVLLFIPGAPDMKSAAAGRRVPYQGFADGVRGKFPETDLLVVDLLDATFDYSRFNVEPFDGHASPYGNQIIARPLYGSLIGKLNELGIGPPAD